MLSCILACHYALHLVQELLSTSQKCTENHEQSCFRVKYWRTSRGDLQKACMSTIYLIFNRLMPVCGDEVDLEHCGGVLHLHGSIEKETCLVHLTRLNMRLNEDNGHYCRKKVKVRIPELTVAWIDAVVHKGKMRSPMSRAGRS